MKNTLTNVILAAGMGVNFAVTGVSNLLLPFVEKNRSRNVKTDFHEFVHDQTSGAASQLKMGYQRTSSNGCGCFAAYNAALLKGKPVKPAEIIEYFEKHGGIVLDGLLGVNPLVVRNFLRSRGFCAKIHSFPRDMDTLIAASKTAIIVYVHKHGMHYVAVEYAEGSFRVYNEFAGGTGFSQYPSLNKWLKNSSYFAVSLIQVF